ncbi:MAG: SCO family protein [Chloroflexota bacterium]
MVLQSPTALTDFTLESSLEQQVSLHDFRDQYLLVTFGYTSCPDVCPLSLGNLAAALNELEDNAEKLTILFVTVDPERDRPERLASYLSYFHKRMIGLTGDVDDIKALATQFGVFFEQRAESGPESLFFDHTATIMLVDPDGYLRVVFPPTVTGSQIAQDLSRLLH